MGGQYGLKTLYYVYRSSEVRYKDSRQYCMNGWSPFITGLNLTTWVPRRWLEGLLPE